MHGLDYFVYLSCVFFYYLHLASVSTMFMVNRASYVIIAWRQLVNDIDLCRSPKSPKNP